MVNKDSEKQFSLCLSFSGGRQVRVWIRAVSPRDAVEKVKDMYRKQKNIDPRVEVVTLEEG